MSIQRATTSIQNHFSQPKLNTNNDQLTEQYQVEKIGVFLERIFQNDPAQTTYKREWESFKNLIKAKPVDMDKVNTHLSRIQPIAYASSASLKSPTYSRVSYEPKYTSPVNGLISPVSTNQQNQSSTSNLTDKAGRNSYNNSSDLAPANSYIPRVNKTALLDKFQKLKDKMDQHSDRLIKATQRRDGTNRGAYKMDDRTALRRVALYTKDQTQKNDIFKEIENKLTSINEGNYNNYRFFN